MFDSSHHGGIATAVGVNSVASANLTTSQAAGNDTTATGYRAVSRFDCSRGRPRRERDDVVGGIEERLRDVITLADQRHLGRCRIGVG
jgi:hypothetical protein